MNNGDCSWGQRGEGPAVSTAAIRTNTGAPGLDSETWESTQVERSGSVAKLSYALRMAIDDSPIEALRKQFELEDSSKSPVSRGIIKAAAELLKFGKMPWPLDSIIQRARRDNQ